MDDFSTLEKICPYCDETGIIVNPKFIEWQLNEGVDERPEKEIIKCPMCNGKCIVPTKLGIGILELVRMYNKSEYNN